MRRPLRLARVVAVLVTVMGARDHAQTPQSKVRFEDFSPTTFSVVARDVDRLANAWADVLGVPPPKPNEPDVVYSPEIDKDRTGGVRMTSLRMNNMTVSLHQPLSGRTHWREILDGHGEVLYRLNFRVRDLPDQVAYFQAKGGRLAIGDPNKSYVNVDLWPRYGVALELNGVAGSALPPPQEPPQLDPKAFANNPVSKIAFVVPDLDQAIKDYADLFGLDAKSATRGKRPGVNTATLRFANGVALELNQPQGGTSIWQTHLQKHGRSIFSVAFRVPSVREQIPYLQSKGGTLVAGGADARYAYFDFTSRLGTVIEVHEQ